MVRFFSHRICENMDSIIEMLHNVPGFDSHGLGLVVTLITANMSSLKFTGSKLESLDALEKIVPYVQDETILDRMLPYIVSCCFSVTFLTANSR